MIDLVEDLGKYKEVSEVLDQWQHRNLIPVSSKNRQWGSVEELKTYLINRMEKAHLKEVAKDVQRIETVYNAREIDSIKITIEWKRSHMYGLNPKAEAFVTYKDNEGGERFYSDTVSGCGYDKESTAVANCLNQVNGLLKRLYKLKNKNAGGNNHELFGYGSGYGILPAFEGGVGVSCYDRIMEKIKLNFEGTAHGKTFDVYSVAKRPRNRA